MSHPPFEPSAFSAASMTAADDSAGPPSPNGMSAAAILATLSDSRPSTSYAAEHILDDDDDDVQGGISLLETDDATLLDSNFPLNEDTASMQQYSAIPAEATGYTAIPNVQYPPPEDQAAGLELFDTDAVPAHAQLTLTLESNTNTQGPFTLSVNHTNVPLHLHPQDYPPTPFEDHLSYQDHTAFMSPSLFYGHAAGQTIFDPHAGLEEPSKSQLSVVDRNDLQGDERDFQGIDWSRRMPRLAYRAKRTAYERSRLQKSLWQYRGRAPAPIPNTDNSFSFRRMDKRHRPWGPHFQLRNMMAATSRNDIFYAKRCEGIFKTDAAGSEAKAIVDTRKITVHGNMCMITTMAAMDDVLIAGGFEGEYAVVDLASSSGPCASMDTIRDWAPDAKSYITNHVHLFHNRTSYAPSAALCSNDFSLRILDTPTNTFTHKFDFPAAVNCSATSPDGRLRVVAGDFPETLITNAETGETLQTLHAHAGDAFACAWADDGIHVASASQDATIAIWDARYWAQPLAFLPSELSIPRVLRFSPVGSGPRVLVSAEADDYVSIINARTFESKQVFDFLGQTGGACFTPDGQSLFIGNSDLHLGGIIELERSGWGEGGMSRRKMQSFDNEWGSDDEFGDWGREEEMQWDPRVLGGGVERKRRGLALGCLDV